MKIEFAEFALPRAGALVVGVWEDSELTPAARQADEASLGAVARAVAATPRFHGKKGELLPLIGPPGVPLSRIVAAGLGKRQAVDVRLLQDLGGGLVAHLNSAGESEATIALDLGDDAMLTPAEAAANLALGAELRAYRFAKYRTTEKPERKPTLARLTVATPKPGAAREAHRRQAAVAEAVAFTRDLVSEPANVIYPETLAEQAASLAASGLTVEVLDEKRLKDLGMGALLGVAQGSARPPRLVTMAWHGDPGARDKRPVCFAGKGVTFDTGGISIKPAAGMDEMKWDMAGAGAVIGALKAIAGRKAKANVVGVVGLVENMPGGAAQRPGDIVATMSGQTVEVLNTDAEGRLVLADAMWYAQEKFAPRCVIDLATLTGAIIVALGHEYAGVFSNDDKLGDQLLKAGAGVEEKLWRFPLNEAYDKQLDSPVADAKNIGNGREAGSITAAQFLQRFIKKGTPWAHLDIAGMAWAYKDWPVCPKGASAFGVRLLDRFVAENIESNPQSRLREAQSSRGI
ncbi:MAG TPA: leucyl aminopeptidase [Alphaproteobacteria bacterium]|nr:leucyl aminopeptidase [Alphaproteobacteria bacterium]